MTLTIGVNGVNAPPRANCSHGSSGSNTQPIGTGSFARPGVSTTSMSFQNATMRRASRCSPATLCAKTTLDVSCAAAASARFSGSSSSGSGTGYIAGPTCQSFAKVVEQHVVDPGRCLLDDLVPERGERFGRIARDTDDGVVDRERDR